MQRETSALSSLDRALNELRSRPRAMWLDFARSDQSDRWRRGTGIPAEEYFQRLPEFGSDLEETLVFICGEIELRRERGEEPALDEYQRRFPQFAADLALQFDITRVMSSLRVGQPALAGYSREELNLPGYEIIEEIGRGASGVVYKARQQSLNRLVAIKILVSAGTDEKRLSRQRQEAEILARFQHPNVVHIYEVISQGETFALVMELVDGLTLSKRLTTKTLNPSEAAEFISVLSAAVHAVHETGVLHRDLKPSNILLTADGQPKITDFGLAKLQSNDNFLTSQDSIIGTPGYMSPEQAIGDVKSIGRETDVYSLGAILYELLTGRPPFLGATVLDTLSLIRDQDPVPPRRLRPKIPRDLETICLKCLNKLQKHRYATARGLADDLQRFGSGLPVLARRAGLVERTIRSAKRHPMLTTVIAFLMVLISAAALMSWMTHRKYQQLADAALVESIATADTQALPELLIRVRSRPADLLPHIRRQLNTQTLHHAQWLNLSLAEFESDSQADATPLMEYLRDARPAEIPLLVPILASRSDTLREQIWKVLADDETTNETRLRFACLAAQVSPEDSRWSKIGLAVARSLVYQHPLDIGTLSENLRPVAPALISPLVNLSHDPQLEPLAKKSAVGILTRFAADQPDTLLALLVDAQPDEFRLLLPSLSQHAAVAIPKLTAIARESVSIEEVSKANPSQTKHEVEWAFDASEHKRTNAATALWLLGQREVVLQSLRRDADPALRAWLIDLMGPLGVPSKTVWEQILETNDSGVRQALILALGQSSLEAMKSADREALVVNFLAIYKDDPDAGVHSATEWLLKTRLDAANQVEEVKHLSTGAPRDQREWYIGPNGHTFTLLHGPVTFAMGSPNGEIARESDEVLHDQQIDRSYAMATEEVTVAQFSKYRKNRDVHRAYSPTDDCPMNNVSWFEAAAYCRWLSEQEGLPEEQMCFPRIADIKPGMQLPADWMTRTGYRLPTSAEWEYACRGGVSASRFCGEGGQQLVNYAWYIQNSDERAWPVGRLKPNNDGLFDMLGNIAERCHNTMGRAMTSSSESTPENPSADLIIDIKPEREIRGGDFGAPNQNVRCARRFANLASDRWASIGIRVARTLPP